MLTNALNHGEHGGHGENLEIPNQDRPKEAEYFVSIWAFRRVAAAAVVVLPVHGASSGKGTL